VSGIYEVDKMGQGDRACDIPPQEALDLTRQLERWEPVISV
jgi:hypothetical protein